MTCRQLNREAWGAFFAANDFVAVVGRQEQMVKKLIQAKMMAFWTPPWQWDSATGCFQVHSLGYRREYRPVLTMSFGNAAQGLVCLLATNTEQAISAVNRTKPFPTRVASATNPHLDLTFADKHIPFREAQDAAVELLGRKVFWWCGRYVNSITVTSNAHPASPSHAVAKAFERALQVRCAQERTWDRRERMLLLHRIIQNDAVQMEKAIVANKPDLAMREFEELARNVLLTLEEHGFEEVGQAEANWMAVQKLYYHACYWILQAGLPASLGFSKDYHRGWLFRRLNAAQNILCRLTVADPPSTNVFGRMYIWFCVSAMELMIPSTGCGRALYTFMMMLASKVAPQNLTIAADRQRWGEAYVQQHFQGWDVFTCRPDPGCLSSQQRWPQAPVRCFQRTWTPAEQRFLSVTVLTLKQKFSRRFGENVFIYTRNPGPASMCIWRQTSH